MTVLCKLQFLVLNRKNIVNFKFVYLFFLNKDIGCGIGGPARHIASFTEANIIGLNCNEYQLSRARILTNEAKLSHLCSFVKVSYQLICKLYQTHIHARVIALSCPSIEGHDSVVVNTPDSQSGGTGFDSRQRHMPGAHQALHPSEVGKLVPASAG